MHPIPPAIKVLDFEANSFLPLSVFIVISTINEPLNTLNINLNKGLISQVRLREWLLSPVCAFN